MKGCTPDLFPSGSLPTHLLISGPPCTPEAEKGARAPHGLGLALGWHKPSLLQAAHGESPSFTGKAAQTDPHPVTLESEPG